MEKHEKRVPKASQNHEKTPKKCPKSIPNPLKLRSETPLRTQMSAFVAQMSPFVVSLGSLWGAIWSPRAIKKQGKKHISFNSRPEMDFS